jgi:acid phosphatase
MIFASRKLLLSVFFVLATTNAWSQDKLIFALDLIRHGDRTPIHAIPKSPPYHWLGEGQLTSEGMRQEYQLGMQLRKKYVDQYHLLPSRYDVNVMYVRSTDYDRTLMSAESLLLGLYPLGTGPGPHGYQPISIYTVPKNDDSAFIPDIDRGKFNELIDQYVVSGAEWKKKNAELESNYTRWSQATGMTITNLRQLSSLGDTLYIDELHHAPLPPELSAADIKTIRQAGKWALTAAYRPKEVGDVMGGPLLAVIIDYLRDAIQQKTNLKYVLLSAHDTSIMSVMSAMRAPLSEPPGYASDLNFAVFKTDGGKEVVKVSFNGKPVSIPGCQGSVCTLEQLTAIPPSSANY